MTWLRVPPYVPAVALIRPTQRQRIQAAFRPNLATPAPPRLSGHGRHRKGIRHDRVR